jgi:transcriptional regulator of met regulon
MFQVIIPAAVVAAIYSYLRKPKDYGVMTEERTKVYRAALSGAVKEAEALDELAGAFAHQGLKEQANLLRKRAKLRRLPDETKKLRREVFRQALESKNRDGILVLANAYEQEGCTAAASRLREVASGLVDNEVLKSEGMGTPTDSSNSEEARPS